MTVTYAERTASGAEGKQEIFFDPRTYAYLGQSEPGIVTARDAWGVVDKPGAVP